MHRVFQSFIDGLAAGGDAESSDRFSPKRARRSI